MVQSSTFNEPSKQLLDGAESCHEDLLVQTGLALTQINADFQSRVTLWECKKNNPASKQMWYRELPSPHPETPWLKLPGRCLSPHDSTRGEVLVDPGPEVARTGRAYSTRSSHPSKATAEFCSKNPGCVYTHDPPYT